jgi:hypothetical protein
MPGLPYNGSATKRGLFEQEELPRFDGQIQENPAKLVELLK